MLTGSPTPGSLSSPRSGGSSPVSHHSTLNMHSSGSSPALTTAEAQGQSQGTPSPDVAPVPAWEVWEVKEAQCRLGAHWGTAVETREGEQALIPALHDAISGVAASRQQRAKPPKMLPPSSSRLPAKPAARTHSPQRQPAGGRQAREPLKQQVWSFAALAQGRAGADCPSQRSMPSPSPAQGMAASKPSFYNRAGPGRPARAVLRPPSAKGAPSRTPVPAQPSAAPQAVPLTTAAGQRQRAEQLAQPRRCGSSQRHQEFHRGVGTGLGPPERCPVPVLQPQPQLRATVQSGNCCAVHASGGAPQPTTASLAEAASSTAQHFSPHLCRPSSVPDAQAAAQQQHGRHLERPAVAAWPEHLGRELSVSELQRATGAYSAERFEQHLQKLSAALAARQQRRGEAADVTATGAQAAMCTVASKRLHCVQCVHQFAAPASHSCCFITAGVEVLVIQVQRLGLSSGPAVKDSSCGSLIPGAEPPHCLASAAPAVEACSPAAQACNAAGARGTAATDEADQGLGSLTARLLSCQRRLQQQRPLTAPAAPAARDSRCSAGSASAVQQDPEIQREREQDRQCQQRPATGSPCKLKGIMQVKGEQDRALQQLRQLPQPFRASPLPLSTMQPRYQRAVEAQEQHRQQANARRQQELQEQLRPFVGLEEREEERQQRRRLMSWSNLADAAAAAAQGCSGGGAVRPGTPVPFRAQPVPVSTTEVGNHCIDRAGDGCNNCV